MLVQFSAVTRFVKIERLVVFQGIAETAGKFVVALDYIEILVEEEKELGQAGQDLVGEFLAGLEFLMFFQYANNQIGFLFFEKLYQVAFNIFRSASLR